MITVAPSRPNVSAMPKPIPRPAPVTTATRSFSSISGSWHFEEDDQRRIALCRDRITGCNRHVDKIVRGQRPAKFADLDLGLSFYNVHNRFLSCCCASLVHVLQSDDPAL